MIKDTQLYLGPHTEITRCLNFCGLTGQAAAWGQYLPSLWAGVAESMWDEAGGPLEVFPLNVPLTIRCLPAPGSPSSQTCAPWKQFIPGFLVWGPCSWNQQVKTNWFCKIFNENRFQLHTPSISVKCSLLMSPAHSYSDTRHFSAGLLQPIAFDSSSSQLQQFTFIQETCLFRVPFMNTSLFVS